ncbi:CHAP domain-containing protein [uncultured Aquimarina sp.]|uniref:CHAP domain-containing protein n=1 Tax=uncultured Aquimarina sp. TaxID=575652 RepID=UPI00261BFA89|nr:CHAP domain-containing protein [uncultured Aquimarina sp.]
MAKAKIIHFYILCFLVCSSIISQGFVSQTEIQNDEQHKRECVKELYDSQVGVREVGGVNLGPHVEMYLTSVELGPGYAWCAAFVSWCYQNAGIQTPLSGWVPSYALQRKRIYQRGKFELEEPQKGDLFLIWYHTLNRPAHIGFIDQWREKWVVTVEGNTNDNGSREGDGVYRKRRLKKQIWVVSDFISSTDRQELP